MGIKQKTRSSSDNCYGYTFEIAGNHGARSLLMVASISRLPDAWPNHTFSESKRIGTINWHYQISRHKNSQAPLVLLIHGTGSSANSWSEIFLELKENYSVVAQIYSDMALLKGRLKHNCILIV
jgi:pimeloyl-ACP methyl ester carboxylesterase